MKKQKLTKAEKKILEDFEKLFEKDVQRKKLNSFSSKRSKLKKEFQKATKEKKRQKEVNALKKIQEVSREEERYRNEINRNKVSKEKQRAEKIIKKMKSGQIEFVQVAYFYYQRKELIDFIFRSVVPVVDGSVTGSDGIERGGKTVSHVKEKIKIKSFLGMSVSKDSEKIISWIDKVFPRLDSTVLLVLDINFNSVVDYHEINYQEYRGI